MQLRIYIDEDSGDHAVVAALRLRDVDVLTALEAGMSPAEDGEHLNYATAQGRVLYSRNVGDFSRLHVEYVALGKPHAGIVLGRHEFRIGDQVRGLLRLIAHRSAEQMANQLEYLSSWLRVRNGAG